jgi:hypothetical protein
MKSSLRYQEGHLYEHHGAWYVRYRRKVRHEDGSSTWKRTARRLGRWCDFTNPFDVRRCRAELMLVVNRDWLSAYSRTTIAAFVDGVFLPWAREERRASTSHGYQAIWRTYLRDRVANIGLREFRTVDANRTLAAIARERDQRVQCCGPECITKQIPALFRVSTCSFSLATSPSSDLNEKTHRL